MPISQGERKNSRILAIYDRFLHNEVLKKDKLAFDFKVDARTIQRDIRDINSYLSDDGANREISYNRKKNGYELKNRDEAALSDSDTFALCKILFDSRAFSKKEMKRLLKILTNGCDEATQMSKIIKNEEFNYKQPKHNQDIIDSIWHIRQSIQNQKIAEMTYEKQNKTITEYSIKPLGLIFNEYYFYLIAEKCGVDNPFVQAFRVDRIKYFTPTEQYFYIEDENRFQEGEFRKKIQFMYTGELVKITFKFWGDSLEAVLDRLPNAEVIRYEDEIAIIEADVYGEGAKRWLLSQKEFLEVIKPKQYREDIKDTIKKMMKNYED